MITLTITLQGQEREEAAKAIAYLLEKQFGIENVDYGDESRGDKSAFSIRAHSVAGDRRDINEEMEFDY